MRIRFRVTGYTGGFFGWAIDDVILSGTDDFDFMLTFDAWWDLEEDYDYVYLEVADGCPGDLYYDWVEVASWTGFSGDEPDADDDDWVVESIDLWPPLTGSEFNLRFRLESDEGTQYRGMLIDDVHIDDLFDVTEITDPTPVFEDFDDPMDDMDNWCHAILHYGQYWDDQTFCTDIPALPINDGLVWETEIADAYEAYLIVNHTHTFLSLIHI